MSGDYSRRRFAPQRDFNGVLMQQGRVQLDADWNEQVEILDRRWRSETVDIVGRCGVPRATLGGFQIAVDSSGQLTIGRGRIYVDGLLAENHGGGTPEFDEVLAECIGSEDRIAFGSQPYVPVPAPLPKSGKYLVYLVLWQREVTFLEAPDLVEKAIGVDTTARLQTVWQVRILPEILDDTVTCGTPDEIIPGWTKMTRSSAGRLSTAVVEGALDQELCLLPPTVGYRGLENRLYRVEIHDGGSPKEATFKWSRDNASVVAAVTAIPTPDSLIVDQTGRDSVLRFNNGDWIEITDDGQSLSALPEGLLPGEIRRIRDVDPATRTITLETPLTANVFEAQADKIRARHTRIRRWDQSGPDVVASQGVLPVPADATPVALEDGIQVSFSSDLTPGEYHSGDYWVFAARTADATIEELQDAPPLGIHQHFTRLALAEFDGDKWSILSDCRHLFPPLTELTGLFYVSGDGQEVAPDPTQPAKLLPLPQTLQVGVANGQWPVLGAQVRFEVRTGTGQVDGGGSAAIITTAADGVASCPWSLDSTTPDQLVEATLLDLNGQPLHLPVRFHASLSVASRVAYEPSACPTLAGVTSVQEAIDRLCQASHGGCCCIAVGEGGEFARLDEALSALQDRKISDVCVCLLPGDHEMIGPNVSSPVIHLSVTGCGSGTRLKILERPWTVAGLRSFALRDVAVTANGLENPLQIKECKEVTVRSCYISQSARDGALVTISDATRVHFLDNVVVSLIPRRLPIPPILVNRLPDVARLLDMQDMQDQDTVRQAASIAAEQAATLGLSERIGIAAELKATVESLSGRLSPTETAVFQSVSEALAARAPNLELLSRTFEDLRDAILLSAAGLAVVLTRTSEVAYLDNNLITGSVSLYGPPGKADLTSDEAGLLGRQLKQGAITFVPAGGTLYVRANQLTRLLVSDDLVTSIRKLAADGKGTIDGIYRTLFLSENVFTAGPNKAISQELSLHSNSFERVDNADAGTVIGRSAVFIGNRAAKDIILWNITARSEKTANLILNIVDV